MIRCNEKKVTKILQWKLETREIKRQCIVVSYAAGVRVMHFGKSFKCSTQLRYEYPSVCTSLILADITYSFPRDVSRRQNWFDIIEMAPPNVCDPRLCYKHFRTDDIIHHQRSGYHRVKPDAVPLKRAASVYPQIPTERSMSSECLSSRSSTADVTSGHDIGEGSFEGSSVLEPEVILSEAYSAEDAPGMNPVRNVVSPGTDGSDENQLNACVH